MFKKLLNVGKGHSIEKLQQQQQQQKNLFQLNEIRSYGFSHLCCLGYLPSLSLLAVGSRHGLLRVLGNSSVEFSYQLESGNSIRQIEFIDCRPQAARNEGTTKQKAEIAGSSNDKTTTADDANVTSTSAKIVVLTDNGQLHLFELRTIRKLNYADNTTQTDGQTTNEQCCLQQNQQANQLSTSEYTKLERTAFLDFFKFRPDDEDRSKRVTTYEVSSDGQSIFVGTEGGDLYQVPLSKFELINQQVQQQQQQQPPSQANPQSPNHKSNSTQDEQQAKQQEGVKAQSTDKIAPTNDETEELKEEETTAVNLNDEPQIDEEEVNKIEEPFEVIKFDEHIASQLGDDVKAKKQGAIESIKRHPIAFGGKALSSSSLLLLSYHRGLNVIFDVQSKSVEKYFYHNQVLESSCFADQNGDFFYTSHNDGSYIKWDTRLGSQAKANEDFLGQLYGPYPCKPTLKIQACTGLINDQLEDLVIFSGGMPRATYDDKNPVTIVRAEADGKDTIKTVLDFTSKVLDFVVITRPRGNLGAGAKSTGATHTSGGGGKKNKHKQQQQKEQQRNAPIAVALAILAEEEFVVIDLLNSESYLEFALPYLNCVHSSAITCNQHYSDISDELYTQLQAYNKQQLEGKLSANEWPITGGKVIDAPEVKSHDILLTGHEDGSVDFWDVSDLSMRHLLHLSTARFFNSADDDLIPIDVAGQDNNKSADQDATNTQTAASEQVANNEKLQENSSAWPPLKRVGRFDPYSDDTRLAIRRLSLCPQTGTLVVAGTGGQVLAFELKEEPSELDSLKVDEITLVEDSRFTWKGREKLSARAGVHKLEPGYQPVSYVQLQPPVAPTSLDLRSDWHLFALGTSYGFILHDYVGKHLVVSKCTLNVQDFSIVSGDIGGAGAISRKKSFRKSLRESFRRLRRGRSQRAQPVTGSSPVDSGTPHSPSSNAPSAATVAAAAPVKPPAFSRLTTGVRTLGAPSSGNQAVTGTASLVGQTETTSGNTLVGRNVYSAERQVEPKVELSSIVRCITLSSAIITSGSASFKPTLWVGTNAGQVLVYAITLASEQQAESAANTPAASSSPAAATNEGDTNVTSTGETQPAAPESSTVFKTTAKLAKEIQLKHRAPIIAIFTSPDAPVVSAQTQNEQQVISSTRSSPEKLPAVGSGESVEKKPEAGSNPSPSKSLKEQIGQQPRVLICSEEQFKVFNLPSLKPFCKFKLTAHEGLRAKKISITQFIKPLPVGSAAASISSKQQQQSAGSISAIKSLQSLATQTSAPASPVPQENNSSNQQLDPQETKKQLSTSSSSAHQASESNNNSISALNNNHKTADSSKELMNAKFGAAKSSSSTSNNNNSQQEQQVASVSEKLTLEQQQAAAASLFEPYMVCMSNQGDCAVYSVPDLKRQAQIQVCKREDVNGITSTMLTNYGEGYYLKSSSNFLRFSISTQRVPRILSVL